MFCGFYKEYSNMTKIEKEFVFKIKTKKMRYEKQKNIYLFLLVGVFWEWKSFLKEFFTKKTSDETRYLKNFI